jgi:predicted permease
VPLSMLFIGSIIANVNARYLVDMIKNRYLWMAAIIKLVWIPLLLFPFLWTSIDVTLLVVAVLLSGMPSAPTTAIFAKKYGADAAFGSVGVCLTTLLSMFSLPLLLALLGLLS